jgi:RNA polymerase sigma-70 factor (ECF subfamily)
MNMVGSLLERCKAGEEDAWRELFDQRVDQIYRWTVLLGLSPPDAADAAQEVLATAARRIHTCRAEEAVTSWLYQIARRVAANHRRRCWWRRLVRIEDPMESAALEQESTANQERELEIRRCLARLPRPQVEVLILIDVEGFTRAEVARILNIPQGTVASRLRLAETAFRTHWGVDLNTVAGLSEGKP